MKFNFTKQQEKDNKKLAEEREKEMAPIVKEVIEIIAEADLAVGEVHARDNDKYAAIAKEVLEAMFKRNMKYNDTSFLFQLILQPFDQIRSIVMESLKRSLNRAETKLFGKDYLDLRLEDIDKIIKSEYH